MKAPITFVVPRMHTNMLGWLEGIQNCDVNLRVLVQTIAPGEDHSCIVPEKIDATMQNYRFSRLFFFRPSRFVALKRKLNCAPFSFIILRLEINITSFILLTNVIFSRLPFAIYQQWPLYGLSKKKVLVRRILMTILPVPFFSPVLSQHNNWIKENATSTNNARLAFIPFAASVSKTLDGKTTSPNNGALRIVSVGKFQERKGHIRAVSSLLQNRAFMESGSSLDIYGEVSCDEHRAYKQKLLKYIKENNAEDRINLFENIEHKELIKSFEHYDIFLLLSQNEPASISNIEAMSCGLPVIIGFGNGTANYLKNGAGGYVVASNLELQNAIDKMFEDNSFRLSCGEFNAKTVREFLEPRIVAKQLLSLCMISNNLSN